MNHFSCVLFFARVCLVLSTIQVLSAQEGEWVDYLIRKEHGIMSVSTDMSLQSDKPNYPNLLIVGIRLRDCMKNLAPRIELPADILERARRPIERMLALSTKPLENTG